MKMAKEVKRNRMKDGWHSHTVLKEKRKPEREASALAPADPHPRPGSPPPHGWGAEATAGQTRGGGVRTVQPVLQSPESDRKAKGGQATPWHFI